MPPQRGIGRSQLINGIYTQHATYFPTWLTTLLLALRLSPFGGMAPKGHDTYYVVAHFHTIHLNCSMNLKYPIGIVQ